MNSGDKLVSLIKSLTKSEMKRFSHSITKTLERPKYIILFELLKKTPNISQNQLKNRLGVSQVSRIKNYLYEKLLQFLKEQYKAKFKSYLVEDNLLKYQILSERNISAAQTYLDNASELVDKYNLINHRARLYSFRISKIRKMTHKNEIRKTVFKLKRDILQQIDHQSIILEINHLRLDLFQIIKISFSKLESDQLNTSIKKRYKKLKKRCNKTTDLSLLYDWGEIKFHYHLYQLNLDKCLKALRDIKQLLFNTNLLESIKSPNLSSFFVNYLNLTIVLGLFKENEDTIKTIENNTRIANYHPGTLIQIQQLEFDFLSLRCTKSQNFDNIADYKKAILKLVDNKDKIINDAFYARAKYRTIYRLSSIMLFENNADEAYFWADQLISNKMQTNLYFYNYSLIKELICHWKFKNYSLVSSKAIFLKRKLKKDKQYGTYEKKILQLIQELIRAEDHKELVEKILSEYKSIFKDLQSQKTVQKFHFDMLHWIQLELDQNFN